MGVREQPLDVEIWRLEAAILAADESFAARCLRRLNYQAEGYLKLLHGNPEMQEPFLRIMDYAQKCNARIMDAPEQANLEAKGLND